jgi:hypothetical protein
MTTTAERPAFEGWAIVELMGHRRLAGHVSEQDIAGTAFLRLDVPARAGDGITQFYSAAAVYCITPTTEDIARKIGERSAPAPVSRFELDPVRTSASAEVEHDTTCADPWCDGNC